MGKPCKISAGPVFFVWGVAERDTNRPPHNTRQSLINLIMEVFANSDRERDFIFFKSVTD